MYRVFYSLIIFILFIGCAVVPITGRKQLSLVPYSQLIVLSEANYKQVIKESKLSKDLADVRMVKDVGDRISKATEDFMRENAVSEEMRKYQWEFNLIEDDEVKNAFCMPGGKVAVYSGIMPIAKDESGLAAVLAHEIAHAIANHGGERLSQLLLVQLGEATLADALSKKPEETILMWRRAYGVGTSLGIILPYSRTQELEADHIGLILMAKAGFDPNSAILFWQRMKEDAKDYPIEFLSTHPAPDKRIEDIRREIPEAMKYYRKQKINLSTF